MNKPQVTHQGHSTGVERLALYRVKSVEGQPDISQETRNLIHAYAREHNYKPNVLAVNLRASRSNTIGVIVPATGTSLFLVRAEWH